MPATRVYASSVSVASWPTPHPLQGAKMFWGVGVKDCTWAPPMELPVTLMWYADVESRDHSYVPQCNMSLAFTYGLHISKKVHH